MASLPGPRSRPRAPLSWKDEEEEEEKEEGREIKRRRRRRREKKEEKKSWKGERRRGGEQRPVFLTSSRKCIPGTRSVGSDLESICRAAGKEARCLSPCVLHRLSSAAQDPATAVYSASTQKGF